MSRSALAFSLVVLTLSACEPPAVSPTPLMVIARDANGQYRPTQVQVNTFTRPVTLEGTAAKFVGAARIVEDPEDPAIQSATTYDQLVDALLKNEGTPVRAHLYNQGGVMWPADYHSWNMATAYYLLERAEDYFRDTSAVPESALDQTTVYYFPDLRFEGRTESEADNALYMSLIDGLFFVPNKHLDQLPLSVNRGVMVHEYSHRIFNKLVHGGARMPPAMISWDTIGATPGINILAALNEGLADFHAISESCRTAQEGGFGCDPRFLEDSLGKETADARDVSLESRMCLSEAQWNALHNENYADYTGRGAQYEVGTIIASVLWQAGQNTGQQQALERAVLDAYSDPDLNSPGLAELVQENLGDQTQFTLAEALNSIIVHVPDVTLQVALCGEILDHLGIARSVLRCPDQAVAGETCGRGGTP